MTTPNDPVADYYNQKASEAKALEAELAQLKAAYATHPTLKLAEEVTRVTRRLERARHVGD
jgi:hypothetical protein